MGWSVMSDPWYTKPKLVKYLVSKPFWEGASCTPVRHSVVGSNLWILLDRVGGEGSAQEVALYQLQGPQKGDEPSGWGYKDIPCREHLDCPAYILNADLCPDYYGEWVAQVRAERAEARTADGRLAALKSGDVLTLGVRRFELKSRVRGGWVVKEVTDGMEPATYKMTIAQARRCLSESSPAPQASTPPTKQETLL